MHIIMTLPLSGSGILGVSRPFSIKKSTVCNNSEEKHTVGVL